MGHIQYKILVERTLNFLTIVALTSLNNEENQFISLKFWFLKLKERTLRRFLRRFGRSRQGL